MVYEKTDGVAHEKKLRLPRGGGTSCGARIYQALVRITSATRSEEWGIHPFTLRVRADGEDTS